MAFADWTHSGSGVASLDGAVKHAGNSSYKAEPFPGIPPNVLTHDTFSEPQAQIVLWTRKASGNEHCQQVVTHSEYGNLSCLPDVIDTWQKWRLTFWYEAAANTKWGRIEKWINSTWEQIGEEDTNFGAGSPSSGSVALTISYGNYPGGSDAYMWFDDVEVSA